MNLQAENFLKSKIYCTCKIISSNCRTTVFLRDWYVYRVNHQCCHRGNRLESPSRDPRGGSPDFLAKSLANPDNFFNLKAFNKYLLRQNNDNRSRQDFQKKWKKNKKIKINKDFVWICQRFSQNIQRPPGGGHRTISAGTTLLVHTVNIFLSASF